MRIGLKMLDVDNDDACIVGDRMDTDILAGLESEIDTVLVLSGVTSMENIQNYAYPPQIHIERRWRNIHKRRFVAYTSIRPAVRGLFIRQYFKKIMDSRKKGIVMKSKEYS